jgi:osmotically-inducible protein OsmY
MRMPAHLTERGMDDMGRRSGGLALEMWRADGHSRASDVRLQDQIWAGLRALGIWPGALLVEVHKGLATLGGTVRSYAEKMLVGNAAARVRRLERIDNLIVVVPAPANAWADDALLPIVTSVLRWDSRVPPGRGSADVVDGHVVLAGSVTATATARRPKPRCQRLSVSGGCSTGSPSLPTRRGRRPRRPCGDRSRAGSGLTAGACAWWSATRRSSCTVA